MRELLKTHGVDNFVLKPVRRSYAFELGEVPRGEQWVLKARYAASKPTLPLGLSGKPPTRLSALQHLKDDPVCPPGLRPSP